MAGGAGAAGERSLRAPGLRPTLILLALLCATLAVGAWGLFTAREEARRLVGEDLHLRAQAQARALEASLASLRSDFVFLTQTSPILDLPEVWIESDPVSRRWRRLDVEATLLRFLQSHPEIVATRVIQGDEGRVTVVSRDGVPVVVDVTGWPREPEGCILGRWPLGENQRVHLEAWISSQALLDQVAAGSLEPLRLLDADDPPLDPLRAEPGEPEWARARVFVEDEGWEPPFRREIEVRSANVGTLRGELEMASRFRSTLGLNLGLAVLSLFMGVIAYREVRRGVAAEAERKQEARVRELERQVMHSERLATVGRLAAGVAHEVNNPLSGMANYLALLEEDVRSGRAEDALETVVRLREGIDRVAAVTRHVLAYADPGRAPKRPIDVREVIRGTVDFLRTKPEFRDNRWHLQVPDEPVRVNGDTVTLGQVFLNLLLNACEARPGGDVRVSLDAGENGMVSARVRDHGPGVSEDAISHIFEPFYSGRGSTGLGLSVCLGIVRAHEGEIFAENHPGGGAVLTVRLPLWRETE